MLAITHHSSVATTRCFCVQTIQIKFQQSLRELVNKNPGRVVTTNDISSLTAKAWPLSLTPINIMSGFKKCGISPLNPGAISDRQLAPSKAVTPQVEDFSTL